jgi:hypothetical protein
LEWTIEVNVFILFLKIVVLVFENYFNELFFKYYMKSNLKLDVKKNVMDGNQAAQVTLRLSRREKSSSRPKETLENYF